MKMADFDRGVKASLVAAMIYLAISAILGAIYYNNIWSTPHFLYGAGLTLFTWRSLTDPSFWTSLLFQYILRGIIFGAVFASLYNFLPSVSSIVKGMVLSLFLSIVAVVGAIYMTPGWPTDGYTWTLYGTTLDLSSIGLALAGIISALIFGALTGFLWGRFRGKVLTAERKGRSVLLVSFILGALTWAVLAAGFLVGVLIGGGSPIQPEFWWSDLLFTSAVFLGLPGWVLADVAWRKTRMDKSGFKWGVVAGIMMALTGIMLLPGLLAIIGGVFSGGKGASESITAESLLRDKIERTAEPKRRTNINRNIILLIASMIMLTITIVVVCTTSPTPIPIEIRTWYDLNATRDNLGGSYLLMNDLDSTIPGYEELASPTANQGKGWQPIGAFRTQQSNADHGLLGFEGTFDGQGYEICALFINRPDEAGVGLFLGVGQEGVIKDIGVVNATLTGNTCVGILVGWNRGTVHDSDSTGNVTGNHTVGGLVGLNEGPVSNSYSSANVTAYFGVGGLVGWNLGNVSNSHSTGSVTGNYNVGGLVGYNFETVSSSYCSVDVTGTAGVGGLVGTGGTVSNSYSIGSVTGNESVGGLVGGGASNVSNSYSTGSVTGNLSVGGLVGDIFGGTVSDSYSTAIVTGNESVGGLVGKNEISTVSNSFWDIETSEQATSEGGTGKTTAEMQNIATFSGVGWNITAVANPSMSNPSSIWNIVDNLTYPFLSWQS
jgi:hypothetical protein